MSRAEPKMTDERLQDIEAILQHRPLILSLLREVKRARAAETNWAKIETDIAIKCSVHAEAEVVREREACARVAETHFPRPDAWPECSDAGDDIAKAIRARGDK